MTVQATEAMQQIRIVDLTGKVVAAFVGNGLTQEISVDDLKAGIYTIQVATATGNSSKQFVKK
jgi:predicted transcriptional regulator